MSRITIWLQRLQDANPENRLKALDNLEILGDAEALPALAETFATDSVEAIRERAQKVGKQIYYNLHRQAETPKGASDTERQRAAEILAQAEARKSQRR